LRKFKALATTLGAAIPVGIRWGLAVETFDQLLCNTSLSGNRKLVPTCRIGSGLVFLPRR
jgi:hypothetical protein